MQVNYDRVLFVMAFFSFETILVTHVVLILTEHTNMFASLEACLFNEFIFTKYLCGKLVEYS